MSTRSPWPVSIDPHGGVPVVCGTVLWRAGGRTRVTVVVKASFAIVPDGPMSPVTPNPLIEGDVPHQDDPRRSLVVASEIAPYLARCDVYVTGHAYAPPGRPQRAIELRLAVLRDGARLLDKQLRARGDRPDPSAPPSMFQKMPLVYERAAANAETNPVGVAPGTRGAPNIALPSGQEGIAGYAPLARWWPVRQKLLGGVDARRFSGRTLDIPDGFDWTYFQVAPPDQRIDILRGDELLVLGGLTPEITTARTNLPGVEARARLYDARSPELAGIPIALQADTLAIDSDEQVCSILFRGNVEIDADRLEEIHVLAGVELPGLPLSFPERKSPPAVEEAPESDPDSGFTADSMPPMAPPGYAVPESATAPGYAVPEPAAPPAYAAPGPLAPPPPVPSEHTAFLEIPTIPDGIVEEETTIAPFFPGGPALPFVPGVAKLPETPAAPRVPRHIIDDPTTEGTMVGFVPPAKPTLPFVGGERPAAPVSEPPPPLPITPIAIPPPAPQATPYPGPPSSALIAPVAPPPIAPMAPPPIAAASAPPIPPPSATEPSQAFSPPADEPTRAAPPPPSIPARRSEAIPVFGSTPLIVVTLPWRVRPPEDSLTVIVKGTFALVPDGPAEMLPETDPPIGDKHLDDDDAKSVVYPSDLAIWKPKADVTLVGHAVAPGGSSPASSVRFRFGGKRGFSRQIAVFGERRWQKTIVTLAPTDPKPFQRIPLVYENAFGGAAFDKNPTGVGLDGAPGPDGVARLPHLEDPDHLITSPTDKPAPACFAPVSMMWKERWQKLGSYDAKWLRTRWPYFPEDFDWTHFQSAPPSQQLDYLHGDEPWEVTGMDKAHPVLGGRLPGRRVRCFFQKTEEAGGAFEEVVLRLDSVAFDIDAMKLNLVWRGVIEVSDEDAPEIAAFYAMMEPLSEQPAPVAAVRERFLASLVDLDQVEEQPAEEPPVANDPEPEVDPEIAAMEAAEEARRREIEAKTGPMAPPDQTPPDPEQIAAALRRAGVAEPEIERAIAALSSDEPLPPAPDPALRERVVALLREGAPLDGLELDGADLSELDFQGRSLIRTSLRGASLRRARLAKADLTEALLSGADLTEADLEGANLSMADVTETVLVRASFRGAHLHGADFGRANGEGALFERAGGEKTSFEGGTWTEARFDGASIGGADFTGAILDHAIFLRAEMPEIMLYDARGSDVSFEQASIPDARADGVSLPRAMMRKTHAPGSIWERAVLDEASFLGATLSGASFVRAACDRADFSGADLREAVLRRTKLASARFVKANLMAAILERADLAGADLRGSNLHGAETRDAKLEGAKLDLAIVTQSKLEGRS